MKKYLKKYRPLKTETRKMNDEQQTIKALSNLFKERVEKAISSDLPKYNKGIIKGCEQIITVAQSLYKHYIPLRKMSSQSILVASKMSVGGSFCNVRRDTLVDKYMTWLAKHPLMQHRHIYYGVGTKVGGRIQWNYGPYALISIIETTRTKTYADKYVVGKDYINLLWGAFAMPDCEAVKLNTEYFILTARRI